MPPPKVLACITTRDGNPPLRVKEMLEAACREAVRQLGASCAVVVHQDRYSAAHCRNMAVQDALAGGFSHLYFCDDDVYPPPGALAALLRLETDVAAGVYPSIRTEYPGDLAARTYVVVKQDGAWLPKFFRGVRRVEAVGAGALLIRTRVFGRLGFPWFRWPEVLLPDGRLERVSDDLDFCDRCRELGIEIVVDGDVRCGHVKSVDVANFVGEED